MNPEEINAIRTRHHRPLKLLGASILATALTGFSAGCSAVGSSAREVGVVIKTLSQPYYLYLQAGAEQAGEDGGVKVKVTGAIDESAVQEQVDKIRAMMSRNVSALVVAPTEPIELEPILQQTVDDGIPVLLVDNDIPGWNNKLSFIGTDNVAAGKVGASSHSRWPTTARSLSSAVYPATLPPRTGSLDSSKPSPAVV